MELNILNKINSNAPLSEMQFSPLIVHINDTLYDLRRKIKANFNINIQFNRLGITCNSRKNNILFDQNNKKLIEYGVQPNDQLIIEDLGYQINIRSFYTVQYSIHLLIPLFIFYYLGHFNQCYVKNIAFIMNTIHCLKRLRESNYIHTFSNETISVMDILKKRNNKWRSLFYLCWILHVYI